MILPVIPGTQLANVHEFYKKLVKLVDIRKKFYKKLVYNVQSLETMGRVKDV